MIAVLFFQNHGPLTEVLYGCFMPVFVKLVTYSDLHHFLL